ncbi:MAG: ribbon-helix-helix protein, CopG family, partial [Deinococcota bacterium]|nr:ribbon-helix-helix protein, CopG family [Deinococcota bacterium]
FQEENMPRAKQLQGDKSDWGGARTGAGRPAGSRLEPGERAQVVSFTLSPKLVAKLAAEAERRGRSRSLIVEEALKAFLL